MNSLLIMCSKIKLFAFKIMSQTHKFLKGLFVKVWEHYFGISIFLQIKDFFLKLIIFNLNS